MGKSGAASQKPERNIFFGTFPSEVRPEFITKDALELVTTYAMNTHLHFGAQSGSDEVLRALRRGHTVRDVDIAVDRCREHGLVPVADFIIGLSMESEEDEKKTMHLIQEITRNGRVRVHHFLPLPGTPLARSVPHPLLPSTTRLLGRLALNGTLTGSWKGWDTLL